MSIDPDFIITINGENITNYVHDWTLIDDEKKSSITVVIKNPDQKWSEKFDTGQQVTIIFGYVGNMGEKITMDIKTLEESYSVDEAHDFIKVIATDCIDSKLANKSVKTGVQTSGTSGPPTQ